MTGVADLYTLLKKRPKKDSKNFLYDSSSGEQKRFVVLSEEGSGSNLMSEILHSHPEITMHREVFSPIDIFTYHPEVFRSTLTHQRLWTVRKRNLSPFDFLNFVWSGESADSGSLLNPDSKAVGFESFPKHWSDGRLEDIWKHQIFYYPRVKKIVVSREDELAVFVAMKRAELLERNNAYARNERMTFYIDPAEFQTFLSSYRDTFNRKYASPNEEIDTIRITYEQLTDEKKLDAILPQLWNFLEVRNGVDIKKKKLPQDATMDNTEGLSEMIDNYDELEYCFRYSDVLHFVKKREEQYDEEACKIEQTPTDIDDESSTCMESWSLLLPICSRPKMSHGTNDHQRHVEDLTIDFDMSSQDKHEESCWKMLEGFIMSLSETSSKEQLKVTECIVGIDVDDLVYQNEAARKRIQALLPCKANFVDIQPEIYGQVFKIWNVLAQNASHDFIVPVGDDVRLYDPGWQERMVRKFYSISKSENLPLGAACVSFSDIAFPGVCTFPALHRWHIQHFGSFLPDEFTNQGGDPYLFELYSRFNAAAIEVSCRLSNQIGGYGDPRYIKSNINWEGQFLTTRIQNLSEYLSQARPKGICLDVVVPSYRMNNNAFLKRIALLRASTQAYVRFWFVLDNPDKGHIATVTKLADELNESQLKIDGNYFVNVVHYGANKGACYARNVGYNSSTADWVLFLDDDVIPEENILDAYVGAIRRYPEGKVFLGLTELPMPCNTWTNMLCACEIGLFYAIPKLMEHPPCGVTANMMVRASRHNNKVQFKELYPKTGGGEDIDICFQFKEYYKSMGKSVIVGVPEAEAHHPWWNNGKTCFRQVAGWAWGDSNAITEWRWKTFLVFPNWIEYMTVVIPPLVVYSGNLYGGLMASLGITLVEHTLKAMKYFSNAKAFSGGGLLSSVWIALGAGSIYSVQEITRLGALVYRGSLFSLCRRFDYFDGDQSFATKYHRRESLFRFGFYTATTWAAFQWQSKKNA